MDILDYTSETKSCNLALTCTAFNGILTSPKDCKPATTLSIGFGTPYTSDTSFRENSEIKWLIEISRNTLASEQLSPVFTTNKSEMIFPVLNYFRFITNYFSIITSSL